MIAHYGYEDAEGAFYLVIDTDRCSGCADRPCVAACPRGVLVVEEDPYGDAVVVVDDARRRRLRDACAGCKPNRERPPLPCVAACSRGAIRHSW